jgi:hypothetical protein
MRRTTLALTLLIVVTTPLHSTPPAADPVTVPFEMLQKGRLFSGHFAVQVKVNGKGPYRLIFDTGAPMILLSNKVAKEANLLGGRRSGGGSMLFPGQVVVGKLEVGATAVEDVAAIVMDHPTVKAIADVFGPIDGIVGFPFFARYRTAIDYQAKALTLAPTGYKPADTLQALMTTLMSGSGKKPQPRVLAPAAQWGMRVEKAADDDAPGVTVAEVFDGSAAAKAGLKVGDRILTLDGHWTDSVGDCYRAAEAVSPGQAADASILRQGQSLKLTVTPTAGI